MSVTLSSDYGDVKGIWLSYMTLVVILLGSKTDVDDIGSDCFGWRC